jgi:hypothetical protein
MIWYVLIAFTAILLGMFTSVKAFGTGGKTKENLSGHLLLR